RRRRLHAVRPARGDFHLPGAQLPAARRHLWRRASVTRDTDMAQIDVAQIEQQAIAPAATRQTRRATAGTWGERIGIVLIVLGILGLVRPWVQAFFTNGFTVLLVGTIIFIIASHI